MLLFIARVNVLLCETSSNPTTLPSRSKAALLNGNSRPSSVTGAHLVRHILIRAGSAA